jgi:hypothetical protein
MSTETVIDRFLWGGFLVEIFEYVADNGRRGYGYNARGKHSFSGGLSLPSRLAVQQELACLKNQIN